MAEMTPRERSDLIRRESRDYIAALRQGRLQRTGTPVPAPAHTPAKGPSAFRPSSQASAHAMEARAKLKPAAIEAAASPREEAAAIRRTSAETLSQMRDARRPKSGNGGRSKSKKAEASARSDDGSIPVTPGLVESASPAAPLPGAGSVTSSIGSAAVDPDTMRTSPTHEPSTVAPQRRARSKRTMPSGSEPAASTGAGATRDIDAITGLGPALKSKLRQSAIATVGTLSVQKPERLREVLGPAGRLVNLDALVRAAQDACGGAPPGAASPGSTRASSRMAASRKNES